MEGSPYCRKVRETLCRLDLDCHIKNASNRGPMRDELRARGGKKTVPYLVDPNTDTEMYESDDIVDYLRATYG
jgi:glutathione S-transferase